PDLVIARYDPGTRYVQILLGTMGGTFTAGGPQFAIPGTGIYDIEILDVGGDDVPDIVLATGGLYVVYGNGAGGFSFGYAVNVGSTTVQTVCSADFDQDGTMDVAVSDLNSALKVAWGSANPPFSTYVSSATPGSGWDLQTGRAERDGRQFLYLSTSGLNQVAVMQPGGTPGSFTTAATYATGGDPEELVLGDLNRDGLLDVFTANSATGNISVFAGSSTLVTGVSSSPVAPSTRLEQNAPNPFNPRTTIRFSVAEPGAVRLDVYDVQGRHVSTLVDGMIAAGDHAVPWDGRSDSGSSAASGVYFYRLRTASGESESRRMVMVR
ncbi:MAG TPA: FlgD immunoglobulin-like domain containing protein, partial [Candidatus Eisenbacteria bacterium]|nr:FlgD immunoglobulin-like domain containing protein [Candidatus Eisenbacteria bacterium]